jgi:PKD repeat protein
MCAPAPTRPRAPFARALGARGPRAGAPGQSLVEFALVLPVLLLLTLAALDFGRVYLGWVNLQNMARIAANFAANNPDAWASGGTDTITAYRNQILSDASAVNCQLEPAVPADPTFSDADGDGKSRGIGDHATVSLTCDFQVLTPVISNILGGTVQVTASSTFPVKSGLTATGGDVGGGGGCVAPNPAITANPTSGDAPLTVEFRDASGGGPGDSWEWDFGDGSAHAFVQDPGDYTFEDPGTYVVTLTVTNACGSFTTDPGTTIIVGDGATPPPTCTVPEFVANGGVYRSQAQGIWEAAGFTTTVQGDLLDKNGHDYKIKTQDITGDTVVACDSTITVGSK